VALCDIAITQRTTKKTLKTQRLMIEKRINHLL